jgi:hypothetical protein
LNKDLPEGIKSEGKGLRHGDVQIFVNYYNKRGRV